MTQICHIQGGMMALKYGRKNLLSTPVTELMTDIFAKYTKI